MFFSSAKVSVNKRMTTQDWYQDVRHFEFDFEDDVKYDPGDVAVIHPVADAEDVQSTSYGDSGLSTEITQRNTTVDTDVPETTLPEATSIPEATSELDAAERQRLVSVRRRRGARDGLPARLDQWRGRHHRRRG